MEKTKVLFITHEMEPFTKLSALGNIANSIATSMQKKGMEVRVFMPRFGKINERRHRLHEVIRLSGINIPVGEEDNPMIIKVASLPSAKMQVYFLDNEDLYKRKNYFSDDKKQFFDDNDERLIFFNRGVIEILLKLGWTPDIVHCHGWFSGLIPLYARTTYKKEPVLKDSKFVFSAYPPCFKNTFGDKFTKKALQNGENAKFLEHLDDPCIDDLHKAGMAYSDGVALGCNVSESISNFCKTGDMSVMEFDQTQDEDTLTEAYYAFYNSLLEKEKV